MKLQAGLVIGSICAVGALGACKDENRNSEDAPAGGGEPSSSPGTPRGSAGDHNGSESGDGGVSSIGSGGDSHGADGAGGADGTLDIPAGGVPWPNDGGPTTAYEVLLPEGCELFPPPISWTDDEKTTAAGTCDKTVSVFSIDTGTPTTIAKTTGDVALVSADPERVVFTEATFLKSAKVNGGGVVTLASDVTLAEATPDRQRIVYTAPNPETGDAALYSVSVSGGEPTVLSPEMSQGFWKIPPVWHITANGAFVWFMLPEGRMAAVPTDGGSIIEFDGVDVDEDAFDQHVWTRDGLKLAVQYGGAARVLSPEADGPADIALPNPFVSERVEVAPLGDYVWVTGYTTYEERDKRVILGASIEDGEWHELAKYQWVASVGVVGSKSDQLLLVGVNGEASPAVVEVPLKGGSPKILGTLSTYCTSSKLDQQVLSGLSADRSRLAFMNSAGSLVLADLDTAKSAAVVEYAAGLTSGDLCNGAVMSPDNDRIAFYSCLLEDDCGAVVVDAEGKLLASTSSQNPMSFSPDSSLLEQHDARFVEISSVDANQLRYKHIPQNYDQTQPHRIWIDSQRVLVEYDYAMQKIVTVL